MEEGGDEGYLVTLGKGEDEPGDAWDMTGGLCHKRRLRNACLERALFAFRAAAAVSRFATGILELVMP